jgi:hypothetical protein
VIVPIKDSADEEIDKKQQVDTIFTPRDYFKNLFCTYDASGAKATTQKDGDKCDLHRYKYLSHVRNVNTKNMAGAGVQDDGLFSVIHSHQTGPLNLTEPKPVIVHLVTLEGIEDNIPFSLQNINKSHVALVSLYSWTYLCLPPDAVNFIDTMRHIGSTITPSGDCWLRAPESVRKAIEKPPNNAKPAALTTRLKKRVDDGFVLQRYLLQTGEETVSFFRGPLSPTYVPPITSDWWPYQSNFSTDYQIVDPHLGVMDISYSAAWQLGRTLGIADQTFSAALVRLRSAIQTVARIKTAKDTSHGSAGKSKAEFFSTVANSIDTLHALASSAPGAIKVEPSNRFVMTLSPAPNFVSSDPSSSSPVDPHTVRKAVFARHVSKAVTTATSGTDPNPNQAQFSDEEEVFIPFSEISVPNSGDWKIVQNWILNNMFLKNIPAHYLIPDASFLPRESIQFFYIDTNWMDTFIDGALSIGNHLSQTDDAVRQALKHALNNYFKTPYKTDHPPLNYFPQIPCFGFLLRSSVVKAFPNLEVHAPWRSADDPGDPDAPDINLRPVRAPVLRLDTIEKDVLFCLFDRMPGSAHWDEKVQITISQPPHQQCFRLGGDGAVTPTTVEVSFRELLTKEPSTDPKNLTPPPNLHEPVAIIVWTKGGKPDLPPLEPLHPSASAEEKAEYQVKLTAHNNAEQQLKTIGLPDNIFDWDSRCIAFPAFGAACNKILNNFPDPNPATKYFDDDVPTSAVTGTMLTSFISQMKINIPEQKASDPPSTKPQDTVSIARKIRIPDDARKDTSTWKKVHPDPKKPDVPNTNPIPDPSNTHMSTPSYPKYQSTPKAYINKVSHPAIPDSEKTTNAGFLRDDIGPQFVIAGYALRQRPITAGPATITVYSDPNDPRNIPFDLVITLKPPPAPHAWEGVPTTFKLQLYTVEIDIPIGDKPTDLCHSYDGPGGKMLSNPRFNVLVTLLEAERKVRFTLVPRSTGRLVPLRNVPDMSFVIWQVRPSAVVNPLPVKTEVKIAVTENYRREDRTHGPFDPTGAGKVVLRKVLAGDAPAAAS